MKSFDADFRNSVFTYYVTNSQQSCDEFTAKHKLGSYTIFCSEKTEISCFQNSENTGVVIIGYCVDSTLAIKRACIAEHIAGCSEEELTAFLMRLGGKYAVFVFSLDGLRVYTDATATLPVFYSKSGENVYISSLEYFIAKYAGAAINPCIREVIQKGDSAKTLSNTMTCHENISTVLPNHYYDAGTNSAVRYIKQEKKSISSRDAVSQTAAYLKNIASQLLEDYTVKCPLTGGYDSRVVFAILHSLKPDIETYTMAHNMPENHSDIAVPAEISKSYAVNHILLKDADTDPELKAFCDNVFGEGLYSEYTLKLACTLNDYLKNSCLVNGDIIGQIGKSSLHQSIPAFFMGPRYYNCKIHNTSKISRIETRKWYKSIKKEVDREIICDNFSEEIRLGRWAANENNLYSLFGITAINIFNCKNVIELWKAVPRTERKKSQLHMEYIKAIDCSLLDFAFDGAASWFNKMAKSNDVLFYIATFVKQYIQVLKNIAKR